jgi:hypothetical protein
MRRMDQPGRSAVSGTSTGAGSAQYSPGVAVYDVDGEKLGTVSDWQEMRHFLIMHQGRLLGHNTYVPHAVIKYSDMNGVHLRLRHDELSSMQQPTLQEQVTPLSMALPMLAPDMGMAAVAAMAFADDATSHPDPSSTSSVQSAAQSAVEAAQEDIVQTSPPPKEGKSRRLWPRCHR